MPEETNYWKIKRLNRRQVLSGGLALGAGLVGLSAGCSSTPTRPAAQATTASSAPTSVPTAAPTATPAKPKPTGKLTVAIGTLSKEILDPQVHLGGTEWGYVANVYDPLVMRDLKGKFIPGIATKWSTTDSQTWEFEIRKGVKFHNGDPVTAKDVKFTIERTPAIKNESSQANLVAQYLDSVEILDDFKIRVKLTKRYAPFLTAVEAGVFILPKDYFEKLGREAFVKAPIGTGPFRFVKGSATESIEMEAVEDHWLKVPNIKTLLLRVVPDMNTRVAMLRAGEADIAAGILPSAKKEVESNPNLRVVLNQSTSTIFYVFIDTNKKQGDGYAVNTSSPWNDKRLRQAANYAIDRQLIADKLYLGTATPAVTTVLPNDFGADPNLKPYPYDPEKAKVLLKEAGYADGINTDLTGNTASKDMLEVMANMLGAVGIKCKINMLEQVTFLNKFSNREMPGIAQLGHPTQFDGWRSLYHYTKTGPWSGTADTEFDKLIDAIESEPDEAKRAEMMKQAVHMEYDKASNIFVINTGTLHGASNRVQDWNQQLGLALFKRADEIKLKT